MNRWMGKTVGVLMGGLSREREISLRTGEAMASALERRGYQVVRIDVTFDIVAQLRQTPIHVAVIALHGKYGEDGTIQGLLDYLQIPYTGTGVLGSALSMDKALCKRLAFDVGIRVPRDVVVFVDEGAVPVAPAMPFAFPVVVKPCREGSTIGMTIVREPSALVAALALAAQSDSKMLIEEYITGKELTIGIVCGQVLPSIEIVPKSGFYDYTSKYTKGMTEYILPGRIAPELTTQLTTWTESLCRLLDCRGMARADYMVAEDGKAYFLELNTVPGMTETSLVPQAAAYAGISFEDVCERVLNDAGLREHA